MKRKILAVLMCAGALVTLGAGPLEDLNHDLGLVLAGITQDLAPTLPMSALGGDGIGDASTDLFAVVLPGIGFTFDDGLGTILSDSTANWHFGLPMSSVMKNIVGVDLSQYRLIPYPNFKFALGFNIGGGRDIIVSGFAFPQSLTSNIVATLGAEASKASPEFSVLNVGVRIRQALLTDKDLTPALSVGAGYTYSGTRLGLSIKDVSLDLSGQPMTLNGTMGFDTSAHVVNFDIHMSKHLLILMPYAKVTALFFGTSASETTDIRAVYLGNTNTISHTPKSAYYDTAVLLTTGVDVLFINVNTVFDLGRLVLKQDNSAIGYTTEGVTATIALKLAF